jgi:hypothetical protein
MTGCSCPDVQYGVHLASCGESDTMTAPGPLQVGPYRVTVDTWHSDPPVRWLNIIGGEEDAVSIDGECWPALVAALRQLGVIR